MFSQIQRIGFRAMRSFSTASLINKEMVMYEPLPKLRDGMKLNEYIAKAQLDKFDRNGNKRKLLDLNNPERLRADDVIKIHYKNQKPLTGMILALKRCGVNSTIRIRNKLEDNIGIEHSIPVFNPQITKIEIMRRPHSYRPRNKHYYIRETKIDVNKL